MSRLRFLSPFQGGPLHFGQGWGLVFVKRFVSRRRRFSARGSLASRGRLAASRGQGYNEILYNVKQGLLVLTPPLSQFYLLCHQKPLALAFCPLPPPSSFNHQPPDPPLFSIRTPPGFALTSASLLYLNRSVDIRHPLPYLHHSSRPEPSKQLLFRAQS